MRDVIIVGGGLTGLSAANTLQQLHIPYTLIEVKNRLGGSIYSERQGDFVLDGGTMCLPDSGDWSFLNDIGLSGAVIALESARIKPYFASKEPAGQYVLFKHGAQTLTDTLARPLTGLLMTRMAASSIGQVDGRFGVCLENGLVLDTRAVIITAPARYSAHMLYDLNPELSARLTGYLYDSILRLNLVYRRDQITLPYFVPPDIAYAYVYWTDDPHRTLPGYLLLQLGLRLKPSENTAPDWIGAVLTAARLPLDPLLTMTHYWPEADPLTCFDAQHKANMAAVERLLPPGVALVGSDYHGWTMAQRVQQGRAAAQKIAAYLGTG